MGGIVLLLWCACACAAADYGPQMPLYDENGPAVRAGPLDDDYSAHTSAAQDYEYDKVPQQESVDTSLRDTWGHKYRNRHNEDRRVNDLDKFNPDDDFRRDSRRQSYDVRSKRYRGGRRRDTDDYKDYRNERRVRYDSTLRRRRRPRDRQMEIEPSDEDMRRLEAGVERELDVISLQKEEEAQAQRMLGEDRSFRRLTTPTPTKPRPEFEQYDHHYYDTQKVKSIKDEFPLHWRPTQARLVPPPPLAGAMSNRRVMDVEPAVESTDPPAPTSATVRTTTRRITITTPSNSTSNASRAPELSVAERSRLSILKKALRKEMQRGGVTSKPPVLLQVTRVTPTVVMVEPQSPRFRAEDVAGESPGRLRNVKRLMRSKLLANARSVQDLTDNWDELVCDYVDTSLLENGADRSHCTTTYLVLLLVLGKLILDALFR